MLHIIAWASGVGRKCESMQPFETMEAFGVLGRPKANSVDRGC